MRETDRSEYRSCSANGRERAHAMRHCLAILLVLGICFVDGVALAEESTESIRIARPAVDAKACTTRGAGQSNRTFSAPGGETSAALVLPDGAQNKKSSCCGVESEHFAITLMGPSAHFGFWLRQSLFPTLCNSVLCRRQCALSAYEPCNTLGRHRGLIRDSIERGAGCNSGGCGRNSSEPCGDSRDQSSPPSKAGAAGQCHH